jgi:pilus assembly protein CpaB
MKTARLVVLGVAVAAGGLAAMLAGKSDPPPAPAPQPATVQIDSVEILVAKANIGMGDVVSANDVQWQIWPTAAASLNFIKYRKGEGTATMYPEAGKGKISEVGQ